MIKIQTEIHVGTLTSLGKNMTVQRSAFSKDEQSEIQPGRYVVLQTEYGPWRFLVTFSDNSVFKFESYGAPGEDV